jgi:hypothetical protein
MSKRKRSSSQTSRSINSNSSSSSSSGSSIGSGSDCNDDAEERDFYSLLYKSQGALHPELEPAMRNTDIGPHEIGFADCNGERRAPARRCVFSYPMPTDAHYSGFYQCTRGASRGMYCRQHTEEVLHLAVAASMQPAGGMGLWTTQAWKKDAAITMITGDHIIVPHDYAADTLDLRGSQYVIRLSEHHFIDAASDDTALGRTINCAAPGWPSNVYYAVNNRSHTVAVRASRNIRAGKELLASYGHAFWHSERTQQQQQPRKTKLQKH